MKKLLLTFATAALSVASAASYHITIFQPSQVGDHRLKPGEYKVELTENTAVFSSGKEKFEMPVKVENADKKFDRTTVRYNSGTEIQQIQQIQLRGTNTKLVFPAENANTAAKDKIS